MLVPSTASAVGGEASEASEGFPPDVPMGFRHYVVGKPHGLSQMMVPSTASAVEGEASEASRGSY